MDRRAGGACHPRRATDPDFRHHGRAARPRRLRLVVPGRLFASGGAGFLCHVGFFDRRRFAAPAGQDGPLSEAVYDRPLQPDLYRDGSGAGLWLRRRFHRPADISGLRDLRRRLLRRHLQPDQHIMDAAATTAHMGAAGRHQRPAMVARLRNVVLYYLSAAAGPAFARLFDRLSPRRLRLRRPGRDRHVHSRKLFPVRLRRLDAWRAGSPGAAPFDQIHMAVARRFSRDGRADAARRARSARRRLSFRVDASPTSRSPRHSPICCCPCASRRKAGFSPISRQFIGGCRIFPIRFTRPTRRSRFLFGPASEACLAATGTRRYRRLCTGLWLSR